MNVRKPLVQRCTVSAEAMDFMLHIASKKFQDLEDAYKIRGRIFLDDMRLARTLRPLVKNDQKAIDLLRSNMLGLTYESIDVVRNNDKTYLKGVTKPIVAIQSGDNWVAPNKTQWDLGAYEMYIPESSFFDITFRGVHAVPQREPINVRRHFHHVAYREFEDENPLNMQPSWCAAEFASIFCNLLGMLDFPGVFKIFRLFLMRFNAKSPLSSTLSFAERIT